MFHRFAAASAIAALIIAAGALASLLLGFPRDSAWMLTTAWCFVPLVWGLWAMLAPSSWVPRRLWLWGAILGLAAGFMAGPVLHLPLRLTGLLRFQWFPVVVGPLFYGLLWMLVGVAYNHLSPAGASADAHGKGAAA